MSKRLVIAIFLSGLCQSAWAGLDQWTSAGPGGADVTAIGMPVSGGFTFYAGSAAGNVYRTTDGAIAGWSAIGNSVGGNVTGVGIDPGNAATLFVATSNKGFFRSTDSGGTWTAANSGLPAFFGQFPVMSALATHPVTSGTVLIGTNTGVYRSTDSGVTWAASNTGLSVQGTFGTTTPNITALAYRSDASTILAGTSLNGVFRSTDGGATWTATTGIPNDVAVNAVELSLSDSKAAYAATAGGLYKSTDNGATWKLANALVAQGLSSHPSKTLVVYAATSSGVQRSIDGGTTWSALGSLSGSLKTVRVNPGVPFMVLAGGSGGLSEYRVTSEMQSPTAFSFSAKDKVPTGAVSESDTVTIVGLTSPSVVTISGGKYKIGLGAYTDKPGLIYNGQTLTVQLTAATAFSTTTKATVTIGAISADFSVTTFSGTPVTNTSQVFNNPPGSLVLGSDGSIIINGNPGTLTLNNNAPNNSVIQLPTGQSVPVVLGSSTFTFTNLGGSGGNGFAAESAYLKVVPGSTGSALEIAQGAVQVQSSSSGAVLPLTNSSATGGATLTTVGSSTTVVVKRNSNGSVSTNVGSGSSVQVKASGSSSPVSVQGYETVALSSDGTQLSVKVGSLSGTGGPGDPVTPSSLAKFIDSNNLKLPDLSAAIDRTSGKTLGDVLIEAIKSSLALTAAQVASATYSKDTGLIIITLTNGSKRYYLPVGEVKVGGAASGGNGFAASSASGTFELAASGLTFSFASSLGTYSGLEEAAKKLDPAASVQLGEGGILIVTIGGIKYAGQPGPEATGGGTATNIIPGFELSGGFAVFKDNTGARQSLYPVFASHTALYDAFKRALPSLNSINSNNNGTSSANIGGTNYTLVPEYALINAPLALQNSEWWLDGTKFYIRYPDLTAQGFLLVQ